MYKNEKEAQAFIDDVIMKFINDLKAQHQFGGYFNDERYAQLDNDTRNTIFILLSKLGYYLKHATKTTIHISWD